MIQQLYTVLIDVPLDQAVSHADARQSESLLYCLKTGRAQRLWDPGAAIRSLHPWQQALLYTLPSELRAAGMAPAALQWRGEGGILRPGTWMQVQLVNVDAGLSDVNFSMPEPSRADEAALMQVIQPLLLLSGFEVYQSPSGGWYVWSEKELNIETRPMRSALTTSSYEVMPSGADAQFLRRLITEIQMLLHQHPVNQRREQAGAGPFNALWFSGGGSPVTTASGSLQRIMSDVPYVQGLCDQLSATCWPLPHNVDELVKLNDHDMVLVLSGTNLDTLDRDWLSPLLSAVRVGDIGNLHVCLDQWRFSLQGGRWSQLRRWLSPSNSLVNLLGGHELP